MGDQTAIIQLPRTNGLRVLQGESLGLTQEMLTAYMEKRLGSLRHERKSLERDLRILHDFIGFTRQPPWLWTSEAFISWCAHLGLVRKLAVGSQRHYQSVIRTFMRYLTENVKFRNETRQRFAITMVQICTTDNCIPHVAERELSSPRRAMTHAELAQFFGTIDQAIREELRWGGKNYHPLRRDRVLFFTVYVGGLRISEALGLNLESFHGNPRYPEFGRYGYMSVFGKGSKGSGPKHRTIPVDNVELPAFLEWYVTNVRPRFLERASANERAFFLSERGNRLSRSVVESRFAEIRGAAGLDPVALTIHSLRHSSVTHGRLTRTSEAMRFKHGHAYSATTEGYNDPPEEFAVDELNRFVDDQLRAAKGESQ